MMASYKRLSFRKDDSMGDISLVSQEQTTLLEGTAEDDVVTMETTPADDTNKLEGESSDETKQKDSKVTVVGKNFAKGVTTCTTFLTKFKKFLQTLFTMVKSLLGLLIILALYSVIGAAIFQAIESPYEQETKTTLVQRREGLIFSLKNVTHLLQTGGITQDFWENRTRELVTGYEDQVYDRNYNSGDEEMWSFYGALFFCGTVYTTIGYGNITPRTDLGKIVAIIYAILGIPLALLCLAELGKKFTIGLKVLWAIARRYYHTGTCRKIRKRVPIKSKRFGLKDVEEGKGNKPEAEENIAESTSAEVKKSPSLEIEKENGALQKENADDTDENGEKSASRESVRMLYGVEIDEEFNLPFSIALVVMCVYIFIGGIMYPMWETEWTFLDSFYFVFISISTIGFGDLLPAHPKFFLITSLYLFIGLSLVSMCINVAIEFVAVQINKAKHKMDQAKDKMTEVGKEKMAEVGKHIDKAKEKVNEVSKTVNEVTDKVAEDVKKNLGNVQREIKNKDILNRKKGTGKKDDNTETSSSAESVDKKGHV